MRIAYLTSRITEPFYLATLAGIILLFSSYLNGYHRLFWGGILLLVLGILPLATLFLGLKTGKVEDIDFTDRRKRTPFILIILFYWLIGAILAWALSGPAIILDILIIALIIGSAVLVINLYWKISNHTLGVTTFAFFVNQFFGWQYWWLFILIPIVAWSRWVQKKHTIGQLIAGVCLGALAWGLFLWL